MLADLPAANARAAELFLCAIKDVDSQWIVGYRLASRMTADLAARALRNAPLGDDPVGVVVLSDRGLQLRSTAFVLTLKKHQLTSSSDALAASGRAPTMPRCNRSSRCCKRMS